MYSLPPVIALGTLTTVVGAQTTTLVAAVGTGFRPRVSYISLALGRTSTGIVNVQLRNAGVDIWESTLDAGVNWADGFVFPEPGVSIADNGSITLVNNDSVAGDSIRWVVAYYIDLVS